MHNGKIKMYGRKFQIHSILIIAANEAIWIATKTITLKINDILFENILVIIFPVTMEPMCGLDRTSGLVMLPLF